MTYDVAIAGKNYKVELKQAGAAWSCTVNGRDLAVDVSLVQAGVLSILIDGKSYVAKQEITPSTNNVFIGNERFEALVTDARLLRFRKQADSTEQGVKKVTAQMPGKVVRILAAPGDAVEAGQSLLVIEAMKMQNETKSPKKGIVKKINVVEGAPVDAGQVLAEIE